MPQLQQKKRRPVNFFFQLKDAAPWGEGGRGGGGGALILHPADFPGALSHKTYTHTYTHTHIHTYTHTLATYLFSRTVTKMWQPPQFERKKTFFVVFNAINFALDSKTVLLCFESLTDAN